MVLVSGIWPLVSLLGRIKIKTWQLQLVSWFFHLMKLISLEATGHMHPFGWLLKWCWGGHCILVGINDLKHAFFKVFGLSLCNFHLWQPTPPTAS